MHFSKKYLTNNSRHINVNQSSFILLFYKPLKSLHNVFFLQFCYIFKIPWKGHLHKPMKFHFTILQALESLSNVLFLYSLLNSNAHACTVHMSSSLHVCGRGRKWLSANAHMLQPKKLTYHDNFVWHSLFPLPS